MKITESQLKQLIRESLTEVMSEEGMDEGFLSNLWGGVKNAAQSTGQAVAQRGNKFMADYNAGAAQSAKQDIQAQIQKSQQVIAKEQQKINDLRAKYNKYVKNSQDYTSKANQNAANRGSNTRYSNPSNLSQDKRSSDFRVKNRLVAESRLEEIIRESIRKHAN